MSSVDLSSFELHNIVRTALGLKTRKALASIKTPTASTVFVAAFTIESPFTTEPWHYLFEQHTTTGVVTLRVFTEEFVEMFNYPVGILQADPVISYGVINNQIMINSPAFSAPLYGLVGGGVITAVKTDSVNEDTTALDLPSGHICTFGDRFVIAQGNVLFFNDPGTDPRTFVAENAVAMPGSIYDIFQGQDGALYIFTSSGVFSLSADALGQGQSVTGFISRIPGINTSRPRNAIATGGANVVLQKDKLLVLGQGELDVSPYDGRRFYSKVVDIDDMRLAGQLFPTPDGFLVGFRGSRGFYLVANLRDRSFGYVWSTGSAFNVVGTLRSRDGEMLVVFRDRVVVPCVDGLSDYDGNAVRGVACGRIPVELGDDPVVRRVTMAADSVGGTVRVYVSGTAKSTTTPTKASDTLIGTAVWGAGTALVGRQTRTVRHSMDVRSTDPNIEVVVEGGDVRIGKTIDVELNGQGRKRRDRD